MRLRWWLSRRQRVSFSPVNAELLVGGSRRTLSARHRELLASLSTDATAPWSQQALRSCLERLGVSTLTQADRVAVVDGWVDGPKVFCVVYRNPDTEALMGLRRHADDAREAVLGLSWVPGRSMTAGHAMADVVTPEGEMPDPVGFGWNVANFDIGEPHAPDEHFQPDEHGIYWHGNLDGGVPQHP